MKRMNKPKLKHEHIKVYIVTGTPGVGKSSVSKQLVSKINAELVSIGDLVSKEGLYVSKDLKRDTLIADMEKISNGIKDIISHSTRTLVVEGHYAVDVVPKEIIDIVFVLRRNPEELTEILENREYGEIKVRENVAAEILDVCLYDAIKKFGVKKVCEIDVSGRTTDEVTKEILQIIQDKKKCKIRIVDWLGKLYSDGKLDEYLKEF
jgi:adenylate kinase